MLAARGFLKWMGCIWALLLIPFVISLKAEFPNAAQLDLKLFSTVVLWIALGFFSTAILKEFISKVRLGGYVYGVGHTLMGLGLSGLVTEPLYLNYRNQEWNDVMSSVVVNATFVVIGIWAFMLLGRYAAGPAIRQILTSFTWFTLFTALVGIIWQEKLFEFFWWVPQMKPPVSYAAIFTVFIAMVIMPFQVLGADLAGERKGGP